MHNNPHSINNTENYKNKNGGNGRKSGRVEFLSDKCLDLSSVLLRMERSDSSSLIHHHRETPLPVPSSKSIPKQTIIIISERENKQLHRHYNFLIKSQINKFKLAVTEAMTKVTMPNMPSLYS
ncbi:hypothetical protein AAHE18_05G064200 [Arachis hypogaea]